MGQKNYAHQIDNLLAQIDYWEDFAIAHNKWKHHGGPKPNMRQWVLAVLALEDLIADESRSDLHGRLQDDLGHVEAGLRVLQIEKYMNALADGKKLNDKEYELVDLAMEYMRKFNARDNVGMRSAALKFDITEAKMDWQMIQFITAAGGTLNDEFWGRAIRALNVQIEAGRSDVEKLRLKAKLVRLREVYRIKRATNRPVKIDLASDSVTDTPQPSKPTKDTNTLSDSSDTRSLLTSDKRYGRLNQHIFASVGSDLSEGDIAGHIHTLNELGKSTAISEQQLIELFDYSLNDTKEKGLEPIFALISTIEGLAYRKALQDGR